MKTKTHSVVYKNLVRTNREKLSLYHKNANIAASVFTEFFLSLFGGINRNNLRYARYDTTMKSEQGEEEELVGRPEAFPDAVTLFFHWFSLEDVAGADQTLCLPIPEVMPRFRSYLKEQNVEIDTRWLETLDATVKSAEFIAGEGTEKVQDRTWVDRRLGNKRLVEQVGFKPDTLDWLFDDPDFILQEKQVVSNSYARNFISENMMDGKKSPWDAIQEKLRKFAIFVSKLVEGDSEKLRLICCKHLGVNPDLAPNEISSLVTGKSGRPSSLFLFLGNKKKVKNAADLCKLVKAGADKADHRASRPKDNNDAWEKAKAYLQRRMKLDFHPTFWNEFAGLALRRLRSARKNMLNMTVVRYMLDRTSPIIPDWLKNSIDQWCQEHKQPHLWDGDIGGLAQIEEAFTGNYGGTVALLEKNSRNRRLNFSFLKMVAALLDTHPMNEPIEVIRRYQVFTKNVEDFTRLRCPKLARFTNFPDHPGWGESRPDGKYLGTIGKEQEDGQLVHRYQLQILTKAGVETIETDVVNKRASSNLFVRLVAPLMTEGEVTRSLKTGMLTQKEATYIRSRAAFEVERRTKLLAQVAGKDVDSLVPCIEKKGKKLVTIEANSGIKLYMKEGTDRPYLYVTYDLPSRLTLPMSELVTLQEGWRFLSFDPGIRTNITYCVGEIVRCNDGNAFKRNDGSVVIPITHSKGIRIIEHGALKEKDFKREGKHRVCRFESDAASETGAEARAFWERLRELGLVKSDCPVKMNGFIREAVYAARRYVRGQEETPDLALVLDLTNLLKFNSHNSGHLSYGRLDNLKSLKSLYQLCRRKNPQPWLEECLEYVTAKVRNVREDRFRRLPNLVCQLAIRYGVKAVFPENTGLSVHNKTSKWLMRRVDSWTPLRVLAQCGTQLSALGIYMYKVWSDYSSHTDFARKAEVKKPRYGELTADQIKAEIDYYSSLKGHLSETKRLYRAEVENWLACRGANWDNWKEKIDFALVRKDKFPSKGGEFYCNDLLGWMNADDQAAILLLRRGLESLLGYNKPKKKSEEKRRKSA